MFHKYNESVISFEYIKSTVFTQIKAAAFTYNQVMPYFLLYFLLLRFESKQMTQRFRNR